MNPSPVPLPRLFFLFFWFGVFRNVGNPVGLKPKSELASTAVMFRYWLSRRFHRALAVEDDVTYQRSYQRNLRTLCDNSARGGRKHLPPACTQARCRRRTRFFSPTWFGVSPKTYRQPHQSQASQQAKTRVDSSYRSPRQSTAVFRDDVHGFVFLAVQER